MSMPSIMAYQLTRTFHDPGRGSILAVDSVDITAWPGEIYGLLGPNGAGKTTTLRMLSTVLSPTSGEAIINGFNINENPLAVRRSIGFLSGDTALYPRLSPWETLIFFGQLHGLHRKEAEQRSAALIERLELEPYAHRQIEKLSTGNRQKVNLARAVLHDPPVLILDEPTTGLDVMAAGTLIDFIEERRDAGRCIIFSTHILTEAERLCDRIAIIHDGEMRGLGTLAELRQLTGEEYLDRIFRRLIEKKVEREEQE